MSYQKRMIKVLNYLNDHIEQEPSLSQLSQIAHCSKFHFQRQFSSFFGISPKQYSQQLKLKRAAYHLMFRAPCTITDIAFEAGFANSESFSRAFKKLFGCSPSSFKKQDFDHSMSAISTLILTNHQGHMMNQDENMLNVDIVELPEIKLAAYRHFGCPSKIMHSVKHFISWRMAHHTPPSQSATFNLVYHDPMETPAEEYRFDICAQTENDIADNDFNVVNQKIPAGRYAKFRHIGSDQLLGQSIEQLYGQWLPNSGYNLADFPCILQRVAMYPDVTESSAITDIFLPLA